jgi:hypothetical protein
VVATITKKEVLFLVFLARTNSLRYNFIYHSINTCFHLNPLIQYPRLVFIHLLCILIMLATTLFDQRVNLVYIELSKLKWQWDIFIEICRAFSIGNDDAPSQGCLSWQSIHAGVRTKINILQSEEVEIV